MEGDLVGQDGLAGAGRALDDVGRAGDQPATQHHIKTFHTRLNAGQLMGHGSSSLKTLSQRNGSPGDATREGTEKPIAALCSLDPGVQANRRLCGWGSIICRRFGRAFLTSLRRSNVMREAVPDICATKRRNTPTSTVSPSLDDGGDGLMREVVS